LDISILFNKILITLGVSLSEEDKRLIERWSYAVEHYGAKISTSDCGRWRLSLDVKKVYMSSEFKEALSKAHKIMNNGD
jgi:hypothetical protein